MIRRFGEPPHPNQKYKMRPGAYALLPLGRHLLLTSQDNSGYGGEHYDLQLPGGGIDHGETPIRALHREVLEETGWKISKPRHFATFRRFVFMPEYNKWAEKICHIFVARPTLRVSEPIEKLHEVRWMSAVEGAASLRNPGDRYFAMKLIGML